MSFHFEVDEMMNVSAQFTDFLIELRPFWALFERRLRKDAAVALACLRQYTVVVDLICIVPASQGDTPEGHSVVG
jgi:hypothetical protein